MARMGDVQPLNRGDFDWVTARHECSIAAQFAQVAMLAKQNVARRMALREPHVPMRWELVEGTREIRVLRERVDVVGGEVGVILQRTPQGIVVSSTDQSVAFTATVTLNAAGACRFKVDGDELELWQLLQRALEGLFFNV
jgi:hypothetical protein